MRSFSDSAHKHVNVGRELLSHTIWPLIVAKELWAKFLGHLLEQISEWVSINHLRHDALVDVVHSYLFLLTYLQIEDHLVVVSLLCSTYTQAQ